MKSRGIMKNRKRTKDEEKKITPIQERMPHSGDEGEGQRRSVGSSAQTPLLHLHSKSLPSQKAHQTAAAAPELFKTTPTRYLNFLLEGNHVVISSGLLSLSHLWGPINLVFYF